MPYTDGLKHASVTLDPLAALDAGTDALLGINTAARDALSQLGIKTVADLATAPLFDLAYQVSQSARGNGGSNLRRLERIPGGFVDDGGPQNLPELAAANLSAVRNLSASEADTLRDALQVETVADLGRWLPYRSARAILAAAINDPGSDNIAGELVPKFGEFPTERRFYSTIVMDHVVVGPTTELADAGPVDIMPAVAADFGFSAPAVGARLTLEQSWYAHGVTLGNLLHSVALAPGESTRIAVVDWSRRTTAGATEDITETEALAQTTAHNRAVSEVQEATAKEIQTGFSHTESESTTKSAGGGFGLSIGPISAGGSGAIGRTNTSADSFSTSVGSRELGASMSQKVMDATQQAASSVRNRRASIVKEVSEQEHEQVSTRILANYNHMHALTVQYYEVVEVYRVRVSLNEVERCLFVPMKLVNFSDEVIEHFQGALADAALDRRAREMLTTGYGMVSITPAAPARPFRRRLLDVAAIRTTMMARTMSPATDENGAVPTPPPEPPPPQPDRPVVFEWAAAEIRRASRITGSSVVQPGNEAVRLPNEATLESISLQLDTAPGISAITLKFQHGQPDIALNRTSVGFLISGAVPLEEIEDIAVTADPGNGNVTGSMTLSIGYRGSLFPVTVPVNVARSATSAVVKVGGTEAGPELVEHLRANRLHYNQAIWRSFDASTIALLLSRFTFEGRPVADLIDPRPIQIAGNYLVFRMPGFVARPSLAARFDDDDSNTPEAVARRGWREWLNERGLIFGPGTTTEQLVPVPTGGVFAEAVLGRSNSAELLDATRFWNWQDSPIPLQPPEIAAINMGSRAQRIDVTPGHLGQPVLNIVNPSTLPDPTGLGPMLGALQNGNMFRDMSGLAATIGLASETGSLATSAANESQRLAAANLAVAAQKDIEEKRIAAQLALAAMGMPSASSGTPKNISEMGAVMNSADARDKQKAAAGKTASPTSGGGSSTSGGGAAGVNGGGGSAFSGGGGSGETTGNLGDAAYSRAVFGSAGAPLSEIVSRITDDGGGGGGGATVTLSLPNVALGSEIMFFANSRRVGNLDTFEEEINALAANRWVPAFQDFRAIIMRSQGMKEPRPDAQIDSLDRFFRMLLEPVQRFHFFAHSIQVDMFPPAIVMSHTVEDGSFQIVPEVRNGVNLRMLDQPTLARLDQLAAFSTDPLAETIRRIRKLNKDTRQMMRNEMGDGVQRQLFLWLCVPNPPDVAIGFFDANLFKGLANLLDMDVHSLAGPMWYRPILQASPQDQFRGRIALHSDESAEVFTDVHLLMDQTDRFP